MLGTLLTKLCGDSYHQLNKTEGFIFEIFVNIFQLRTIVYIISKLVRKIT